MQKKVMAIIICCVFALASSLSSNYLVNVKASTNLAGYWATALSNLNQNRTYKQTIEIPVGDWFVDSALQPIPSHTAVYINGHVKFADYTNTSINMFSIGNNTEDILITGNGELDGNAAHQNNGGSDEYQNGIYGIRTKDVTIRGLSIHDFVWSGVLFSHRWFADGDVGASRVTVTECNIQNCVQGAVHFHLGNDCTVKDNTLIDSSYSTGHLASIYFYMCLRATITGNLAKGTDGCGITLINTNSSIIANNNVGWTNHDGINLWSENYFNTITGNIVTQCEASGVFMQTSNNNTITGNTILDSAHGAYNWSDGIILYSSNRFNQIHGNIISSSVTSRNQKYGIEETDGTSDYNRVSDNTISGYVTGQIRQMGSHSSFANNT
jgi:parallel beta-helix repeat protein